MKVNKILLVLLLVILGYKCYVSNRQTSRNDDLVRSTVMITVREGRSGGTGVVLKSTPMVSYVLTNAHVCKAVGNGVVETYDHRKSLIQSEVISSTHDLCLATVMTDLEMNTTLASKAPRVGDKVFIAGHPSLYPTIISEGRVAGKEFVNVFEPDENCPLPLIFCAGKAITLESIVVSALISPGSSGSAVFNESRELVGLAFAGEGGSSLSYAIVVPLEYIYEFLNVQLKLNLLFQ